MNEEDRAKAVASSAERVELFKTAIGELNDLCHHLKREFEETQDGQLAAQLHEHRKRALRALIALNRYSANALDAGIDTLVFIALGAFWAQFNVPKDLDLKTKN